MKEYKHICFNPYLQDLEDIIEEMEKEDSRFKLDSVVGVSEFQWVAVFAKDHPFTIIKI